METLYGVLKSTEVNTGVSSTWTNKTVSVTLASALTANIDACESGWSNGIHTASHGSTNKREGSFLVSFTTSSGSTGVAIYKNLGGTFDYSSYDAITFWVFSTVSYASGAFRIDLCSDTAGATPVDSFTIAIDLDANHGIPLTIRRNGGGALGSSIQSIAVNIISAPSPNSGTIRFDNFTACDYASLNLNSLISKNDGTWWAIRSISTNGLTLTIDDDPKNNTATPRGYSGTSGSGNLRLINPFENFIKTTATFAANNVNVSGGWNIGTGGDGTQTSGLSFFDWGFATSNLATAITLGASRTGGTLSQLGFVRLYKPILYASTNTGWTLDDLYFISTNLVCVDASTLLSPNPITCTGTIYANQGGLTNGQGAIAMNSGGVGSTLVIENLAVRSMQAVGVRAGESSGGDGRFIVSNSLISNNNLGNGMNLHCGAEIKSLTISDNSIHGINTDGPPGGVIIKNATIQSNGNYAIQFTNEANNIKIYNLTTSGNNANIISALSVTTSGEVVFRNWTYAEAGPINLMPAVSTNWMLRSHNEQGVANSHITRLDGGTIQSDTVGFHGSSGIGWKITPTDTKRDANFPISLSVGRFAVNSGSTVTISAWIKSSGSPTVGRMRIHGNSIAGVTNDIVTSNATNTSYQQYSLVANPTENGVIEVFFEAWITGANSTQYMEISDMSVSAT